MFCLLVNHYSIINIMSNRSRWLTYRLKKSAKALVITLCSILITHHARCNTKRVHAYIVVELDTGKILCKKNINKECHPASLTKKMTLYLLFEALAKQRINLCTKFRVSRNAVQQMRAKLSVLEGEMISVKTIIEALIVKSANDIAVVAAEGLAGSVENFVSKMNKKAKQLKMYDTYFKNPSGVPNTAQVTTARDMAILAKALYKNFSAFFGAFAMRSFVYNGKTYYTHNHLLNTFPGTDGIKTGYTEASGYNISVSIVRYDEAHCPIRLICIIIGQESRLKRDQEVISLVEPLLLKRQAYFYNANSVPKDSQRIGMCIEQRPSQPIFVRAPICTKDGTRLLIEEYENKHKRKCFANITNCLNKMRSTIRPSQS
ncbi:MAG: D-alanyl-D-alanine carboxypeptidase [Holosporales bacterium]|nr:D-alanyl-D-alanine carboxypeptidase [Holosporales bacterium]